MGQCGPSKEFKERLQKAEADNVKFQREIQNLTTQNNMKENDVQRLQKQIEETKKKQVDALDKCQTAESQMKQIELDLEDVQCCFKHFFWNASANSRSISFDPL